MVKISLCMASIRPQLWRRLLESLLSNTIDIEVIFVGDKFATENFRDIPKHIHIVHIYSTVKPAQCYEIAFREATGELVGWTADEVIYEPKALDNQYNFHKSFKRKDIVTGMSCIENGHKTSDYHFIGNEITPRMMVYGFIDRLYFKQLQGYDKNFITGQAENDIVMRVLERGGITAICEDARVINKHEIEKIHGDESKFRKWHKPSRKYLEDCWFTAPNKISKHRLFPVQPFEDENILTISQGPTGEWT